MQTVITHREDKSDFFKQVHAVVRLIPFGRATSYGAIAAYLSAKKASRMVGYAMNAAHNDETIPAHRVVNRNGMLTGKHNFATENEMQSKLESEGIVIENDVIQSWKTVFWDPSIELVL